MHPPQIQILSPDVAEKIAAGEVIERPASVVKELVENALDAGATEIAVVLEQGGKSLIEVIDNGHGITAQGLALAVERHATSKIREVSDLERLSSLGFRGEALPSVRAVAELTITSRAAGAPETCEWAGGRVQPVTFGHFLGSTHGTRVRAHSLFSQVPARLKFLKAQAAEVAQVREWIERLALTHPATGFRLVSDDRTVMNLRPQSEEERVRAILAEGEDYPVVTARSDLGLGAPSGVRVRAHWLQGLSLPHLRRAVQIVNGRAVRDRLVQQALLQPFRQALLPGQFPAIALFVDLDPSLIDVNVHPSKTEIRFLRSRDVFVAIENLVASMIGSHGAPSFVAASAQPGLANMPPTPWSAWEPRLPLHPNAASLESPQHSSQPDLPARQEHPLSQARYVGTLFNTYLAYDLGDEAVLVDQHAAHERIRFERLKAQALAPGARPAPQALLIPEAVRFSPDARPQLEERLGWLESLGFECEIFGDESLLFRAIPSAWGADDLRTRLKSLVERVIENDSHGPADSPLDESLFERLASEACHSAIRAGDALSPEQARALVDDLFDCQHPWNCPHGRPTVARLPRGRFEEWFQRRV